MPDRALRSPTLCLAATLAVALGGCAATYVPRPPPAYQGEARTMASFVDGARVDPLCRAAGGVRAEHQRIAGCATPEGLVLPHPCQWAAGDEYADLLCHEVGHLLGWPANHPPS
jgi:hypothetical protein